MSKAVLESRFSQDNYREIGVDEAGRGPLFGRVYTAAVILPSDDTFRHDLMKDSKKFTSKNKIQEAYHYIKENAISWSVTYEDEKTIDKINIRQATLKSMHHSIKNLNPCSNTRLLIDGNDFKPYMLYSNKIYKQIPHHCIESGDNKYSAIAAASILAKVARDTYIEKLCEQHTYLIDQYQINNNKGYGTKAHIEGLKKYGVTPWHRLSYGICKNISN
tara:strand:- start:3099 stop:3752 length:654 start_codon:yes stop_codon:yes gene_type:complete